MKNKIFVFLFAIFFGLSLKIKAQEKQNYATLNIYRSWQLVDLNPNASIFINGNYIYSLPFNSKLTYNATYFKHSIFDAT